LSAAFPGQTATDGVVVDLLRDGFSYFALRVPTHESIEQLAAHERELLEREAA
jgi:hypothetical protein